MVALAWRTSRGRIALALGLTVLAGVSWPLVALALRGAVDAFVARDGSAALTAGVLVAVSVIGALVLQHFAYVPYAEVAELATLSLEAELVELTNGSAGLAHHERAEHADRIALLRRELPQFGEGVIGLMTALSLVVTMAITSVLLAALSPWLLLLPVAAVPPVVAGQFAQRRVDRAKRAAAEDTRLCEHLFRLSTQAGPVKELQLHNLQGEIRRRHVRHWAGAGRVLLKGEASAAALIAASQVAFAAAYVVAVLLVLRQAVAGDSGVGDVVLVLTLAAQVHQQVSAGVELLQRFGRTSATMTGLRWLRELIRAQEPVGADAAPPERIRRGITLSGVSFTYPGTREPVLTGVDLELPAGSVVAVVGENGAGKTTLAKLLCRFYDATEGTIAVDGVDLARIAPRAWRRRVTAAFQDFVRFELTARHAVGVGDLPRVDDDPAVLAALGRARADDLLDRLDDGLATQLGKTWTEGTELSGGQWQKVALGRAMMREQPLLLVLDEPTSALDAQAEQRLFERYAANARRVAAATGGITLLVSHRFSTVRMADLILVVADGRITEAGGHDDLIRSGGLYAQLYAMQAATYARAASIPRPLPEKALPSLEK
ncbi:ABC transporter ATP-binding protein [Saccharothrix syringae]|uniref:ABC transporter ATP-binding protein n=2 Tax=Saccharothrix syringae TaxID=103733 RepID=A0A5Q0HDN8_SACSY|nr:ABC transporter ATP-binding protein [Saccharothrix syringae]